MRGLRSWQRLLELGATETCLASCSFGSPQKKEFALMAINMILDFLRRPCIRDHQHIPIQGKYTKPSATYCDGLARAIAEVFFEHVQRSKAKEASQDLFGRGP